MFHRSERLKDDSSGVACVFPVNSSIRTEMLVNEIYDKYGK